MKIEERELWLPLVLLFWHGTLENFVLTDSLCLIGIKKGCQDLTQILNENINPDRSTF